MRKGNVVYKYDLKGNFLCSYLNTSQAARDISCDESTIRKAANENKKCKGFIWSRTKTEEFAKYYQGFGYNKPNVNECVSVELGCMETKKSGGWNCLVDKNAPNVISAFLNKSKHNLPKILILDIETSPTVAYIWKFWKENIGIDQVISNWFCLCWSAKWLFADNIMSDRLTGDEVKKEDDKRIIKKLWKILNEADIVIAHNGNQFDLPKINSRFLINGLPPVSSYKSIDTLQEARKNFGFSSNKLEALARQLGLEGKLHTGFELWKKCMEGDEEALEYMEIYNHRDVELLEEVYMKLRPFIKYHPNLNLYMDTDKPCCATCGSTNIKKDSYYYTTANRYQVYRCECGALSRMRLSDMNKDERKNIMLSI